MVTDLQAALIDAVHAGRARQGWSQADLARLADMSQKHISQMLTGKCEGSLSAWDTLLAAVDATLIDCAARSSA